MAGPDHPVVTAHGGPRGPRGQFLPDLAERPLWKLLVRGFADLLPDWRVLPGSVRPAGDRSVLGLPVFIDHGTGFGLHLAQRRPRSATECEVYSRGRPQRTFGVVALGSWTALGTRVVTAAELLRHGEGLVFEALYDRSDPDTAVEAARAARSVDGAIFLDPVSGIGLCAEVGPAPPTGSPGGGAHCPLLVRFGDGGSRSVRVYLAGGRDGSGGGAAAQPVKSHT